MTKTIQRTKKVAKITTPQGSLDEVCVNTIRTLSIDAVQKADSGHPGLPLGAAPMAYVLWTQFLKHNPKNPKWYDRDRFVLSAGHGSALLYSLLHLTGYPISMAEMKQFRQWGSLTPGHPESHITPGVEITTGPLGQGFANGVGMAIAQAHLAERFNKPGFKIIDHYTYGIVSDGDLMEGLVSEAASLAGHLKLGKLIYFYDDNSITLSAGTHLAFTEDCKKRFEAYGWHCVVVKDGNNLKEIHKAVSTAQKETKKPTLILVKTIIGYGSPHKQNTFHAHGSPLGDEEVKCTKEFLGWPKEAKFFVPEKAKTHFAKALTKGKKLEKSWDQKLSQYKKKYPKLAEELKPIMTGSLPKDWDKNFPCFPVDFKGLATRDSSGKVMQAIAAGVPGFLGGSADLNPSTKTELLKFGTLESKIIKTKAVQGASEGVWSYAGRNIYFGIREHAMGSISNGMATYGGLIPFTATFLVFADYMRPPMRLAALMGLHVIFVFTHDSIAVGEDGPTHEPVEQIASLRAIPNLIVIRPGDANEVAVAWHTAIETKDAPVALVFTRQSVPTLDRKVYASPLGLKHGAYVLYETKKNQADIVLIASGSEVHLAVEAKEKLEAENLKVRIVSMPSWELFDKQSQKYKDSVLPSRLKTRLAIEAGISQGWHKYYGDHGKMISVETYGASAPGAKVLKEYGFSVENVVKQAHSLLKGKQA